MSTRQFVELVCDLCEKSEGQTDGIETHTIMVDGIGVEAEACAPCWAGLMGSFAGVATNGRPVPRKTRVPRGVKPWPGTTWRFTSHALIRCGERDLDPVQIVQVIEDPSVTRPGRASDQEIRERNGLKAVVVPDRGIVVTVARKGEEAVDAYTVERVAG